MSTIVEALRAYVLADATVAGLVGTRMYPVILPQDPPMPAITFQIISGASVISNDGPAGLESPTFQIDCWAATYSQMDALFHAVRKRINGAKGVFPTESFLSGGAFGGDSFGDSSFGAQDTLNATFVEVQGIFMVRKRDLYDDETKLHRRTADYEIWNSEAVT